MFLIHYNPTNTKRDTEDIEFRQTHSKKINKFAKILTSKLMRRKDEDQSGRSKEEISSHGITGKM